MTLWLLYEEQDVEKNRIYIQMYEQACRERHILFRLILTKELSMTVIDGKSTVLLNGRQETLPKVCICRARDFMLSRQLEQAGMQVFNSSFVSEICNDKARTYQYLADRQIPMMDSCFCTKETYRECFPYPVVVKSCSGHGGSEVFLVKDRKEFEQACKKIRDRHIVVQKIASEPGKDLRIYVIGKKIVAAVMRESDKDFRSNFSLGGRAYPYTLSERERRLAQQIADCFTFGMVGIDLLFHEGKPVLNEIEDVVGARMLYQTTKIDLVGLYLDHILRQLQ